MGLPYCPSTTYVRMRQGLEASQRGPAAFQRGLRSALYGICRHPHEFVWHLYDSVRLRAASDGGGCQRPEEGLEEPEGGTGPKMLESLFLLQKRSESLPRASPGLGGLCRPLEDSGGPWRPLSLLQALLTVSSKIPQILDFGDF